MYATISVQTHRLFLCFLRYRRQCFFQAYRIVHDFRLFEGVDRSSKYIDRLYIFFLMSASFPFHVCMFLRRQCDGYLVINSGVVLTDDSHCQKWMDQSTLV